MGACDLNHSLSALSENSVCLLKKMKEMHTYILTVKAWS